MARPADRLTLSHLREAARENAKRGGPANARPWIAIRWRCCGAYSRVYRHPDADRYRGACPRCGSPVSLRVAPGGTESRLFEAG